MEKPFLLPPPSALQNNSDQNRAWKTKKKEIKAKQNNTSIDNQHMLTKKKKLKTQRTKKQNKTKQKYPLPSKFKGMFIQKEVYTHFFISRRSYGFRIGKENLYKGNKVCGQEIGHISQRMLFWCLHQIKSP